MKELLKKIETMTDSELRQVMKHIEQRYCVIHPEWDVLYFALHKDPQLRRQEVENILAFMRNRAIEK